MSGFGSGFYNQMLNASKRKVFLSYYHKDDQYYRNLFESKFGHLFIDKSVQPGDIDTDVSDEYIKRLIQEDFIGDASVVVVLLGPKTLCRKHVDWEISAGLNSKVGGISGLFGLLLPSHPNFNQPQVQYANLPERLADNMKTGYAQVGSWPDSAEVMKSWVETAFENRVSKKDKIDNSRIQYTWNRCD